MAYVAPSTRSAGALITASIWNQDVVANPIALYAGAMSIASQAALDVIFAASATQLGRLAVGSALQFLRVNAAASALEFASSLGVIQVLQAIASTDQSTSSTSYVDITSLSVAITPRNTSSKILVIASVNGVVVPATGNTGGWAIDRDATKIGKDPFHVLSQSSDRSQMGVYLDSPASAAELTYKLQMKAPSGVTIHVQNDGEVSSLTCLEIGG